MKKENYENKHHAASNVINMLLSWGLLTMNIAEIIIGQVDNQQTRINFIGMDKFQEYHAPLQDDPEGIFRVI